MATFEQNIRKIRGEAVHGSEMRTAIADAVQQAVHVDIDIDGHVFVELNRIESTDDYRMSFIENS